MEIRQKRLQMAAIIALSVLALSLLFLFRAVLYEFFRQTSVSMQPTLYVDDFLVVEKLGYGNYRAFGIPLPRTEPSRLPQRGEVFVFTPPHDNRYFVKRIIGIPGDKVEQSGKQVMVNGHAIADLDNISPEGLVTESLGNYQYQVKYNDGRPSIREFSTVVPEQAYFVMGDNRDNSSDSRLWGAVEQARIVGIVRTHY